MELQLEDEVGAVRREQVLPVPRHEAWEAALATPDALEGWLADEVALPAIEPGAEGWVSDGEDERRATVEEVEPDRRVALTWCAPGEEPTAVELTLDDHPEGTRLVVVEAPLERLRAIGPLVERALPSRGPQLAAV